MDPKEIEEAKENGRRKLFRVRFPTLYGYKSTGFVCRTLCRGEIFTAFSKVGYPQREIPKEDTYARVRIENDLFPLCVLEVPDGFTLFRSHALVATTIVNESLKRSGFLDGSAEQKSVMKYGLQYANSIEGRTDAIILKYFPSIDPYDLGQMNYEEWSMRSMQAILLAKGVDGVDLFSFLTPDPNIMNLFDDPQEDPEIPQLIKNQVPDRISAAVGVPTVATRPTPAAPTAQSQAQSQRQDLLNKLGIAPSISSQSLGLNQNGNPDIAIEKGATRMFIAGERYDVNKLRPQIQQDSQG